MPDDSGEPLEYLAGRLNDALAGDPRVSELGLRIAVRGSKLYVTGSVTTADRKAAIDEVVGELAQGYEVHNETAVVLFGEPGDVETLS